MSLTSELSGLAGGGAVWSGGDPAARRFLHDETESRAIGGRADAVVLPSSGEQVAAVLRWCYAHDVPVVPRAGGTGYAGGAVPLDGGVVLGVERLRGPVELEVERWRAWVPAGVVNADLRRRAREEGMFYAPDPGSAESSLLGGNVATNAGGPHTFKYGQTGSWVTGLEVVLAPGELVRVGGPVRKDVGGYDLRSLLVGSEGTLGVVTGAWVRLLPAPEAALPVLGVYGDAQHGCAALAAAMVSGVVPATLEFLDRGALRASLGALLGSVPTLPADLERRAAFMLVAEADGSEQEARTARRELELALEDGAIAVYSPASRAEIAALWRWREGVSGAVTSQHGGKISEDIVVPVERLGDAVAKTLELGERFELDACSWGHAGDGNVHATFMIDRTDPAQVGRAEYAAQQLFQFAAALGGAITGEHGVGLVKNRQLALQWPEPALALHEQIKHLFDPKNLLNPGKKLAR